MERLSSLDAGFLEAEDADRHISLAVGGLSVLEGPMPEFATVIDGIADRIRSAPRFRQVLRTHALDLHPPEWVEDGDFDHRRHIRLAGLPRPGDDRTLFRFAADVMERRLDRDRPLWECWIIEGLENDRWAILFKIHHCIADGVATMHLFAGLSDAGSADISTTDRRAERTAPSAAPKSFGLDPRQWIRDTRQLAGSMAHATTLVFHGATEVASGLVRPAGNAAFNGPVTAMRRYSAARVSRSDVDEVKQAYGVTLNDVALAAVATSFRDALIRRGIEPQRDSLRTLVPVSIRSEDAVAITDNRASVMLPRLPVDRHDLSTDSAPCTVEWSVRSQVASVKRAAYSSPPPMSCLSR